MTQTIDLFLIPLDQIIVRSASHAHWGFSSPRKILLITKIVIVLLFYYFPTSILMTTICYSLKTEIGESVCAVIHLTEERSNSVNEVRG